MPAPENICSNWHEFETAVVLSEMAAYVAHKLKNPLAGMMLAATRLRKLLNKDEGREKALAVVEHLCNSIDDFSRSVDETVNSVVQPQINFEPVDINELLKHTLHLLSGDAETYQVEVHQELSPDLPRILGDSGILKKVFYRFLSGFMNAVPTPGEMKIFSIAGENDQVSIRLESSMPEAGFERIRLLMKKPFSACRLSISDLRFYAFHRIIQLHSGAVSLRSVGDSGVELTVSFPAADIKTQGRPGNNRNGSNE